VFKDVDFLVEVIIEFLLKNVQSHSKLMYMHMNRSTLNHVR
jgi:hypothetical protein